MTFTGVFMIKLTLEQKQLFEKWLNEVEEELTEKLAEIKSLKSQLSDYEESPTTLPKSIVGEVRSQSWTTMLLDALKQLGGAQTSTQIVTWFMENNPAIKEKGKRYITKNVTSKLALLVEKGKIEKNVMGGKNVYALKSS
jgi:hypothetical protein